MAAPPVLLALFFASGFAGLVYELLWVRALALVFGNTAQATATTLAVFFLGASLGQLAAGRVAARARNPLRLYAALEILVAATAAIYFAVVPVYRDTFPPLLARLGTDSVVLTAARAVLATGAMAPLSFCMGATLPVMGQLLVRRADELAPTSRSVSAGCSRAASPGSRPAVRSPPSSFCSSCRASRWRFRPSPSTG